MSRIPTEAEIDAMSEDELESYLASQGEPAPVNSASASEPGAAIPSWRTTSGSTRTFAWLLVVAGILGIAASWELLSAEITILREPLANLTCDINPLVSCGDTLNVWQGNLLGVPNSFIGGMAFAVLLALGLLLASGTRLPRWMWWGMCAGTAGALCFIAWFLGVSVLTFGKLCPFCMIIWSVIIPTATNTWGQAALQGHLGLRPQLARRVWGLRWWAAGALYATIVIIVLTAFWDGWVALLR